MNKVKRILQIILMIGIMIAGIFVIGNKEKLAVVVSNSTKFEAFKEDTAPGSTANWDYIPVNALSGYRISLWCINHNHDILNHLTAPRAFYDAYTAGRSSASYSGKSNPYKYYRRSSSQGLIENHRSYYNTFLGRLRSVNVSYSSYEGDDQSTINSIISDMPGLGGNPKLQSTEWNAGRVYDKEKVQNALFALTAIPQYDGAIPLNPENLTEEQKKQGGFTVKEKQGALWEMGISLGDPNNIDDRNLGEVSNKYQLFYDTIHKNGEDKYEDIIEVSSKYYKEGNGFQKTDYIEETKTTIGNDKDLKTYVYKDTIIEEDLNNKYYVLGPYSIDYTVDDDARDVYYTTDGYEIKYNAIEKITVYNQEKKDITSLGGSFKIAYSYNGAITKENEGKVTRINDKYYYTEANGEEISGFDSGKEFYIIVDRKNMKAGDFKGFYAKIDFQYLEHIDGTLQDYIGTVYNYYYTQSLGSKYNFSYSQTYKQYEPIGYYMGVPIYGKWVYYSWTYRNSCNTHIFELHKEKSGETNQQLLAYHSDGKRVYKTYSIVLTSLPYEEEPEIEIYKKDARTNKALYGAEFDVELKIEGRDIYGNYVNKTVYFNRVTDRNGLAIISTSDIEQKGVYLGTFTGTIEATIKETRAPAGYKIKTSQSNMLLAVNRGIITENKSRTGNATSIDSTNNVGKITIENNGYGIPKIQLAKVDKNGKLIEEAYFEVHVSYTDPDGVTFNNNGTVRKYGNLIDRKYNIIRGQTSGGVLNLTVDDFKNMRLGFDITGYTGQITLDIVEIAVDGAFSISSNSRDITLEYLRGELVNYTEFTNSQVTVQYLYDSVLDNVYKYATGQIRYNQLNGYVQDFLGSWVRRQENRTDLSYNDILNWLANYINTNGKDIMRTATTLTTNMLADSNGDIVQITVEDSIGSLPDIPKREPDRNPLFMTVAGTVFLDETETKASAKESDGLLGNGEMLLSGIEVELRKKDGTLATLVQEEGKIRTNPTMTDNNGYYEFKGVDPFEEYYVVFKYNGIEYKNTISAEQSYNTAGWAISSKGSEVTSERNALNSRYSEIGSTTLAYDYYTLQGVYTEIAARVGAYINTNNAYPSMDAIYAQVIANHSDDAEIAKKIDYIKSSAINAYAGYSSKEGIGDKTSNGLYPYYTTKAVIREAAMNANNGEIEIANEKLKVLYPGALQVNLGLVERDRTDLSLLTDIVETKVSMNGYDTGYEMNKDLSSYNQYIYEEDYNYSVIDGNGQHKKYSTNVETGDSVAYYTDDEVQFYMTYEIDVTNATLTDTAVTEIVDYYNSDFSWENGYTTSKGNHVDGYKVFLNGNDITSSVYISNDSRYGLTNINRENTNNTGYKELFIRFRNAYMIKDGDTLNIQLTFKMDRASATLYNNIYTQKGTSDYSKLWKIGNYAEINGYMTNGGYLDSDSRPGNFSIGSYENAQSSYQTAYSNYIVNRTEDNARMLKLALGRLTDVREDDAWKVGLTLANTGYVRELHGSVWEAISNDVKTGADLQDNKNALLTYVQENGLAGISVELVELETNGNQTVRGKTETDANGNYKFTSYIAGDYVVRFIYGEESKDIRGKSTNSVGENLQVNGQYYESTKANDKTDTTKYWYDTDKGARYSDAYDDAKSRIDQMNRTIINTNGRSTSSDYEYDGVIEVETYRHKDEMYAYTSTLNLEVEYVRPSTEGNRENTFYPYKVENVDFGLTPRANADLNIDKYVSNIKIYLQDGTLQLDANIDEAGKVTYVNDQIYRNAVIPNYNTTTYRDGLIEALFDEQLLNGATLEITYTLTVSNDGEYDTIKYIYNGANTPVAIAYYSEEYKVLPSYEGDRGEGTFIYHEGRGDKYSLEKYAREEKVEVRTAATNIVDYIDPNLNFVQVDKLQNEINRDWEITSTNDFNTNRKNDTQLMSKYNTIIRAKDNNALYTRLLPGEKAETTLTLSKVLETSSTETNDWEYSSLIEITKIHNDAGRVIDIEGYDVTGSTDKETSIRRTVDAINSDTRLYPTLATSKSETVVIHAPTGLSISEETKSDIGIVLVVLAIFAAGIVLIKKFVLAPKA